MPEQIQSSNDKNKYKKEGPSENEFHIKTFEFLKKGIFPNEKQFWPNFSRFTEYGRPQVTYYWVPQGILAKKAIFLAKKLFRPIFSRIIEHEKPPGTIYKGSQGILTVIVQVIRSFL